MNDRIDEIWERNDSARSVAPSVFTAEGARLSRALLDVRILLSIIDEQKARIEELERMVTELRGVGSAGATVSTPSFEEYCGTPVGELMGNHCLSRERKP